MISLQNLCLNVIAEEFERFYIAFSMLNNEKHKRNLTFLQIKYSSELGSQLFKRVKLNEKYLGFIINKHLKFLDEQWICKTSFYQNSMEVILRRLPNLNKILCKTITDEILENIAKFCPKIEEIGGVYSFVTDRGVEYLCKIQNGTVPCPELKKLSFRYSKVTDDGLRYLLRNLKSLEKVDHDKVPFALYSLHKDDLPKLENVPSYNIVELCMFYDSGKPYYNDLLKICLTVCPKLKSLSSVVITDMEQLSYFNLTYLENLDILFSKFLNQKINIQSFLKNCGRNLLDLSVRYCILSISQLAVSHPKLQELSFNDVSFTDYHGDTKALFHSLVKCKFFYFEMNSENIKAMNLLFLSSPNLKDVTFVNCDLSPDAKISILKCFENLPLEVIQFYNTRVELDFAKDILVRCPSLKLLSLQDCMNRFEEKVELMQFVAMISNETHISIHPL